MLDNYRNKLVIYRTAKDFVKTLNKNTQLKTKVIRENHKSFITKRTEKGNYETISFEKASKYLQKYIQN